MPARTLRDPATEPTVDLPDPAATGRLGARIGAALRPGDVVALHGDLGAGKTALARAAIRAAQGAEIDVPSPTFTLVQTYDAPGRPAVWHVDLYRLGDAQEVEELGLDEARGGAALLIEWPDRWGNGLPADRLDVHLDHDGPGRRARLAAGPAWAGRLPALTR